MILTQTEFLDKAKKIHGEKYEYSKFIYSNSMTKSVIICPKHGEFIQSWNTHIRNGCPKCAGKYKTTIDFINEANLIHNNKYDYSKTKYLSATQKLIITCNKHGDFLQAPYHHLNKGGCPKCAGRYQTTNDFILKAKKIHGEKYDYSKSNYVSMTKKISIICAIHGIFEQTPNNHLNNQGCPECGKEKRIKEKKLTQEEFEKKANEIHHHQYIYSKTNYDTNKSKITIICPKHGEFIQKAYSHLNGHGCSLCYISKGEQIIESFLLAHNIDYIREKRFKDCKFKKPLPFDFYLPKLNICIEFDGVQHFKKVKWTNDFEKIQIRDKIKNDYCATNKITLIRIPYFEYHNIENILNKYLISP